MHGLMRVLRTLGVCLGLFLATYVPTFVLVHLLSLSPGQSIPCIIAIGALICFVLMLVLCASARFRLVDFGLRPPGLIYLRWALGIGVPLAASLGLLDHFCGGAGGPLSGFSLPIWASVLYFGLGAPLQEEAIFRGLIQTAVRRTAPGDFRIVGGARISIASLAVAVLFGVVHIPVGLFTAVIAFVLGVLAGELRERSGSLIPAIIVHSLFNLCSLFWSIVL
jgi:membrane protease YdiL (CAAX protease family)